MTASRSPRPRPAAARPDGPEYGRSRWLRALGMGALAGVLIVCVLHIAGHLF